MSGLKTAAQQMLEALEGGGDSWRLIGPAIDDLRAALEQPEQESVAMCRTWHKGSDQHAELLDWTDALEALPDGEHHLFTHPPRREPEQEPKWRLSCGCPSQHGGIPAEWPETDREGNPAVAYGVICERHWHEYGARHPSEQEPIGSMKIRLDMGVDISFNRPFTLEPGMEFNLCVAAPKGGKA